MASDFRADGQGRGTVRRWYLAFPPGLLGLMAAHGAIALYLAATLNIWFDEAYTLDTTARGVAGAFTQAIGFEEQAPLYFVLLALWRRISMSIWFARLFSVLCTVLTVGLSYRIGRYYLPQSPPLILPLLVAINPFTLWAAVEIRLYALSLLLSALLLLWFYIGYYGPDWVVARRWRWAYGVTLCLAVYTHYFLVLMAVAQLGVLWAFKRRASWRGFGRQLLLVAVMSLPMGWIVLGQIQRLDHSGYLGATAENAWLKGAQKAIGSFFLHGLPVAEPEQWAGLRLGLGLGLVLLAVIYRRVRPHMPELWLMAGLMVASFCLVFMAVETLHYRHATPLFLVSLLTMVALALAGGHDGGKRPAPGHRISLLTGYTTIAIGLSLVCLFNTYSGLAKPGDYNRVGQYLNDRVGPNQPVLVYNQEVAIALAPYYRAESPLKPLPSVEDFDVFRVDDFFLPDSEPIVAALANLEPAPTTVWLVVDNQLLRHQAAFQPSFEILESFVASNFRVVNRATFYGTEVWRLTPHPSQPASHPAH